MPKMERQTMAIALDNYEIIYIKDPRVDKSVKISSKLAHMLRAPLIEFLKENVDLFAWKPEDMPSNDPIIISYRSHQETSSTTKTNISLR